MKQSGEDSGTGGDWAVRLSAERVAGRGAPRKRISLVMYLGDEGVARPPGWSVMPEGEVGRWDGGQEEGARRGELHMGVRAGPMNGSLSEGHAY